MKIATLTAALAGAAVFCFASEAQAPPVEAYAGLPDVGDIAISPDGSRLVMLRPVEGRHAVIVYSVDDLTTPQRVGTVGDELRMVDVSWADDRHVLATLYGTGEVQTINGMRTYSVARAMSLDADTGDANMLLRNVPGANTPAIMSLLPGEENRILMAGLFRTSSGNVFATYRVNLQNGGGRETHLSADGPNTIDIAHSPDGEPVARMDHDALERVVSIRRNGNGWPEVYRWNNVGRPPADMVGVVRNGAAVVLRGYFEGDNIVLRSLDLETGALSPLASAPGGHDIDAVVENPYTMEVIGYGYTDDRARQRFLDSEIENRRAAIESALGGDPVHIISWSRDRSRFIVSVQGAQDAGSFHLFDANSMNLSPIGFAYPNIPVEQIAQVREITYGARDGIAIPAILTIPPAMGSSPRHAPMVVLPHGGPEARDTADFDWLAQLIASRGYVVLQPNFRGSSGYGANFRNAGYTQWGHAMIDDVAAGVDAMIAQGIADPDRICAAGWSYGGYAALALAMRPEPYLQCVASINGVTDVEAIVGAAQRDLGDPAFINWLRAYVGNASQERLRAMSPMWNARSITEPVLLIQGEEDTNVPVAQARGFERATRGSSRVHVVILPGDDHYMLRPDTRLEVARRLTNFLGQHLN